MKQIACGASPTAGGEKKSIRAGSIGLALMFFHELLAGYTESVKRSTRMTYSRSSVAITKMGTVPLKPSRPISAVWGILSFAGKSRHSRNGDVPLPIESDARRRPDPSLALDALSRKCPSNSCRKAFARWRASPVRRMACRITAQSYPGLFVDLLNDLAKSGAERAGDVIVEFLRRQDAYGRLWPSDSWFADALKSHPLYRLLTRGRLRIILEGIEEELRTDKAESGSRTALADDRTCHATAVAR